ncbi:unnamed protein product [Urochloa humidicola]
MGKAGRWLKSIIAGRRDGKKALPPQQQQQQGDATPLPAAAGGSPREKKRWSFRRPAPAPAPQGKAALAPSPLSSSLDAPAAGLDGVSASGRELEQSEHAVAVAEAAAAAADAAVLAAAEAAAAVARLTAAEEDQDERGVSVVTCAVEEAAAARIQATFRGYLARKALCALRGLVKLQALIRGQLVRRQANATLRRMQALVDAQSRLRAQRARMSNADHVAAAAYHRRSPQHPRRRSSYEMERSGEEHVKIVEIDMGGDDPAAPRRGRSSCSAAATESRDRCLAEYYYYGAGGGVGQCSPAPSSAAAFGAAEDLSPEQQRAYSGHFDDAFALAADHAAAATARSSPYVSPFPYDPAADVPSYMANTESSRAKARSQSAPRQRTDGAPAAALERQPSRRRGGAPTRKMMQRSSSHIGTPAAACGYGGYGYGYGYQPPPQQQNPWAGVRLDRSSASVVGSECGSTSSVLTVGYCRSLVGFEVHRGHY